MPSLNMAPRPYRGRAPPIQQAQLLAGIIAAISAYESKSFKSVKNIARDLNKLMAGKKTYKNQSSKKTKSNTSLKLKAVEKKVNKLSKKFNDSLSTYEVRTATTADLVSSDNQSTSVSILAMGQSYMDAALSDVPFFNPSVPGTLISADVEPSLYEQEFTFKKVWSRLQVRNNYAVPAYVKIYVMASKTDAIDTPSDLFSAGITDVMASATTTSPQVYPTDSPLVRDHYKVAKVVSRKLEAGQEMTATWSPGRVKYSPNEFDESAALYSPRYKSAFYFIRVQGCIAHDTLSDNQGLTAAGIDYEHRYSLTLEYDSGGAVLHRLKITDDYDSMPNNTVCSNKPVVDNQAWSRQ